jgi:hypothetical protein
MLTSQQINRILDTDVELRMAKSAKSGLLAGRWEADSSRIGLAEDHLRLADAAYAKGDTVAVDSHVAWAYHYARTAYCRSGSKPSSSPKA